MINDYEVAKKTIRATVNIIISSMEMKDMESISKLELRSLADRIDRID